MRREAAATTKRRPQTSPNTRTRSTLQPMESCLHSKGTAQAQLGTDLSTHGRRMAWGLNICGQHCHTAWTHAHTLHHAMPRPMKHQQCEEHTLVHTQVTPPDTGLRTVSLNSARPSALRARGSAAQCMIRTPQGAGHASTTSVAPLAPFAARTRARLRPLLTRRSGPAWHTPRRCMALA